MIVIPKIFNTVQNIVVQSSLKVIFSENEFIKLKQPCGFFLTQSGRQAAVLYNKAF